MSEQGLVVLEENTRIMMEGDKICSERLLGDGWEEAELTPHEYLMLIRRLNAILNARDRGYKEKLAKLKTGVVSDGDVAKGISDSMGGQLCQAVRDNEARVVKKDGVYWSEIEVEGEWKREVLRPQTYIHLIKILNEAFEKHVIAKLKEDEQAAIANQDGAGSTNDKLAKENAAYRVTIQNLQRHLDVALTSSELRKENKALKVTMMNMQTAMAQSDAARFQEHLAIQDRALKIIENLTAALKERG